MQKTAESINNAIKNGRIPKTYSAGKWMPILEARDTINGVEVRVNDCDRDPAEWRRAFELRFFIL